MQKKHLCHFKKRTVSLMLAVLIILSTVLTGCGASGVTASALEDEHDHGPVAAETVSDETVSLRETLSDRLDDSLADQAAAIGDEFWENDVPADKDAVFYEYAENEQALNVPEYDTGSSVELESLTATTVDDDYDENGLKETNFEVNVMYTTVDKADLKTSTITEMWDYNYEAFISNFDIRQHFYEMKGCDDVYVAFLNFSELNGTNGEIISADIARGTEHHSIDMGSEVVLDKENGVLYVPKAWFFAGDGTEVGLDLKAQVMVAVDTQAAENTDEFGNLLVQLSVIADNEAGADTVLQTGKYQMKAYDYAVLPIFAPGSVFELTTDDIEVYINGSSEPVSEDMLSYNEETGNLTVNAFAMTLTEVKVVFKEASFLQALANVFSVGEAKAGKLNDKTFTDGMTALSKIDQNGNIIEEVTPNIDLTTIGVGDVLAYKTIGDYHGYPTQDGVYAAQVIKDLGATKFVYLSDWSSADRTETYWFFAGKDNINIDDLSDYETETDLRWQFVMELPFVSERKGENQHPVVVKSASGKSAVGTPINFGLDSDWKWVEANGRFGVDDEGMFAGIPVEYAVFGQCSHTVADLYYDENIQGSSYHDPTTDCHCTVLNPNTFVCNTLCNDTVCKAYRAGTRAGVDGTYRTHAKCDGNCPWCSKGKCSKCADDWGCYLYRKSTGKDYCDSGCATCRGGKCDFCSETIFRCTGCNCTECINYRRTTGLDFCDARCPSCRTGRCQGCSSQLITDAAGFTAGGVCRILSMDNGYMILGLAQVAQGTKNDDGSVTATEKDGQRGTAVIKVRTSVKIMVKKNSSSTLNDGTTGNSCYAPLETAQYTIYNDEELTDPIGTIYGNGEDYVLVPVGPTYYIKETTAPVGYWIDPDVYPVTPVQNTVYDMENDPIEDPFLIAVQKNVENRNTAGITTGDVGILQGLQFDVDWYKGVYSKLEDLPAVSDEHAVFETDEMGLLFLDDEHLVDGETWRYRNEESGELMYPLGTVRVKEKFPIDGLLISNTAGMLFSVTDESNKSDDTVLPSGNNADATRITTYVGQSNKDVTADHVAGSYEDAPARGCVTVTKSDYDWDKSDFQGNATLAGAEYTIYNRSESSVYYKGNIYEVGEAIDTIVTEWSDSAKQYVATTGRNQLEYGTYEIVETKAPTGYNMPEYKPGEQWTRTFTIREDGQTHYFNQKKSTDSVDGLNWLHRWNVDTVMRGGVAFGKVDRETKQYINSGASSLAGAKFEIVNRSEHPVYVDGVTYEVGDVVMTLTAGEMDITVGTGTEGGTEGYVKHIIGNTTGNYVLPYGTYDIREISTGIGYLFDTKSKNQLKTFSIRDEGEMHYFTDEDDAFHNQVQREDWYFQKKADDSGKEMVKVAWTVTSVTTGETHVIVTDENGKYQSDQVPHSQRTNANDPDSPISNGAVQIDEDGDYYVADSELLDYDAGTWFTGLDPAITQWSEDGNSYTVIGGTDHVTEIDDLFRAYPYDTYVVQELASDANEGYNLVSFTVTLKRYNDDPDSNGIILDYGTVDDQHVDIYTTLGYKADGFKADAKSVPGAADTTLTDVITYAGLTAGSEYTMKGELHLVDADGNDEGVVATNETTFTAKASGQLKMDFTLDTSDYAGKRLVAAEEIWQGKVLLTEEEDLTNEDQTVWVAGITATRAERIDSNPDTVSIKDHVDYVNLAIGGVYNMNLSLMDKATGEALLDKDGNAVTAELQFVPGSISGTQDITVTFAPEGGLNTDIVVFEEITRGQVYGEHKDIDDADQTVSFVDMVDTFAVSGKNYSKELSADIGQSVYDCIKLNGLEDGVTYKLEGSVYYINDEGEAVAILDAEGNAITGTIENPDAHAVMMFKGIDATELGGRDIVVFQSLYALDESTGEYDLVFEHADIEDADQIVHVPSIDTELVSTENIHNAQVGTKTVLTDRVDYKNLTPGQTYTATGTLHYREDTEVENSYEAVDMGEVASVAGQVEFTPEDKDGSVEVTFTYDSTGLEGKVVVAFEELYTTAGYEIPDAWASFFGTEPVAFSEDAGAEAAQTRLVASHRDIADTAQSVGFANIKATTLTTKDLMKSLAAGGEIILTDAVDYEGLIPGTTYAVNGTLYDKDTKEVISTTETTFIPETVSGTTNVTFAFNSDGFSGKTVVAFETISTYVEGEDGIKLASHEDLEDAGQSVTFIGLDTILSGAREEGKTDFIKTVEFGYYKGAPDSKENGTSQLKVDNVTLEDVIKYENLVPGGKYTLKGEIHLKNADGTDGGVINTTESAFVPETENGEVSVTFIFAPVGIEDSAQYVAFEYLYEGVVAMDESLIASHADIADEDQTITVKAVDKTPDDKKDPNKNPCGCDDPNCKHKNEKDHCKNNPGCCDDSDCCKNCTTCKHKNPCGCDDPNCKHKNEKDHCKNNPGCCDDSDCCKDCTTCKAKPAEPNKCGCTDPNCKHKNEKDHCKNNPGCCDDADCCKDCTTCKSKAPAQTQTTTKPSKNPVQNIVEAVKTGEHTFLLAAMIGLVLMSGGGYVFFARTSKGRDIFKKIREKLAELFRK